jgi:hypothetical protein
VPGSSPGRPTSEAAQGPVAMKSPDLASVAYLAGMADREELRRERRKAALSGGCCIAAGLLGTAVVGPFAGALGCGAGFVFMRKVQRLTRAEAAATD